MRRAHKYLVRRGVEVHSVVGEEKERGAPGPVLLDATRHIVVRLALDVRLVITNLRGYTGSGTSEGAEPAHRSRGGAEPACKIRKPSAHLASYVAMQRPAFLQRGKRSVKPHGKKASVLVISYAWISIRTDLAG